MAIASKVSTEAKAVPVLALIADREDAADLVAEVSGDMLEALVPMLDALSDVVSALRSLQVSSSVRLEDMPREALAVFARLTTRVEVDGKGQGALKVKHYHSESSAGWWSINSFVPLDVSTGAGRVLRPLAPVLSKP